VRADDPERSQAQKVLAELEQAIREQPTMPPPPSPPVSGTKVAEPQPPATAGSLPAPPTVSPRSPSPSPSPSPSRSASSSQSPSLLLLPSPSPSPSLHASAPSRHRRGLRIAGITTGIAGLGLLGAAIGTTVAADGAARDLNAIDRAGGVFDPSKDRAYTLDRALSAAFFAGGALLAAGGAILVIVSAR
jgi:hypothetical protein